MYSVRRTETGGTVIYEVWDDRPDTYRFVCSVSEAEHDSRMISAKNEAEMIVEALIFLEEHRVLVQ